MSDALTEQEAPQVPVLNLCRNCSTAVTDFDFCPTCGQKSDTHVLSFRELLEELADGLFNTDSRLWRSLLPLILHPGRLTIEYLEGRRMHYLPPFRLYLILSVIYFLIPGDGDLFNTTNNKTLSADDVITLEQLTDTEQEAIEDFGQQIRSEVARELAQAQEENRITTGLTCDFSDWPQDSLLTLAVRDTCLKLENEPTEFFASFIDSIPVMMILGIPLVALMMQLLYVFSHHYYVEHIIFLFHVHAFFFLISITMSLSSLLGQYYPVLFTPMDWYRIIAAWYIPIYMLLAMMRVYGEGKGKTIMKAGLLLTAYLACMIIVGGTGLLVTAVTT